MKKLKFLPVLALMFAVVSAFAFQSKSETETIYIDNPEGGCVQTDGCHALSGVPCEFQVLDVSCSIITRFKD